MTVYTYILVPGGYQILADGALCIDQPYNPELPFIRGQGQPFASPEAARAHAEALIAEMSFEGEPAPIPPPTPDMPEGAVIGEPTPE